MTELMLQQRTVLHQRCTHLQYLVVSVAILALVPSSHHEQVPETPRHSPAIRGTPVDHLAESSQKGRVTINVRTLVEVPGYIFGRLSGHNHAAGLALLSLCAHMAHAEHGSRNGPQKKTHDRQRDRQTRARIKKTDITAHTVASEVSRSTFPSFAACHPCTGHGGWDGTPVPA